MKRGSKPREGRGLQELIILFYFRHIRFTMSQISKDRCYLGSWIQEFKRQVRARDRNEEISRYRGSI